MWNRFFFLETRRKKNSSESHIGISIRYLPRYDGGTTFYPLEFTVRKVQFSPLAGERNVCRAIPNDRLAFARLFARTWSCDCDFGRRFPDSVPQFRYALLRAFCTTRGDQQRFVRALNRESDERQLTGWDDSRFGSHHSTNARKIIDIPTRIRAEMIWGSSLLRFVGGC